MNGRNKNDNPQKELQSVVSMEPKGVGSCVQKAFIKFKNSAGKQEIEMTSSESPASIETVRCRYFASYSNTLSKVGG